MCNAERFTSNATVGNKEKSREIQISLPLRKSCGLLGKFDTNPNFIYNQYLHKHFLFISLQ